jgi:hypothetical protein
MCANQQPGGVARIVALAMMILLPFSIAWVMFQALRRASGSVTEGGSRRRAADDAGSEREGRMRESSL